MPFTCSDIFKIILAIFLPPLGVFLERGCGAYVSQPIAPLPSTHTYSSKLVGLQEP